MIDRARARRGSLATWPFTAARRALAAWRFPIAPCVLAACAAMGAGAARAASPRASLPAIERQVMCVTCKIPLNVAQSPQADRERTFIQSLIDRGSSEAEIKRALVAQYGRAVLALPSTGGVGVLAYTVPLAVVIGLAMLIAVLLPRWRARGRARERQPTAAPPLSAEESARLDADMARFDRTTSRRAR
jgi:cytochrome c-type biogenesis protein CcmH